MEKNKTYQGLLKKLYAVEILGEKLYTQLYSKVQDKNLKSSYQKLALNEQKTATSIEKELLIIDKTNCVSDRSILLNSIGFIFKLLTARQLTWILKRALKRKIYSRYFNIYKDVNQEFWRILLNHENAQYQLLRLND